MSLLSCFIILCSALLVVLSFISTLYANTVSESIYVASKYGAIFLFFITTYLLLKAKLIFDKDLITGIVIFCIISLLYGIYDVVLLQLNNLNILSHSHLISATYGNKNLFASILLLCFWTIYVNNFNKFLKYPLAIFLFAFILLTQSKIVIIAFIFMLVLSGLRNINLSFKKNKITIILGLVLGLAFISIILFNFSKFTQLSNLHTLDTRYSLWINSIEMVKENPGGVGAGNWQIFFPKYGLSHFDLERIRTGMTQFQRPHNDFIWMLCELGFQGLILYLFIFSATIVMLIRLIRKENNSMHFLLLLNLIGYCMVAFFDFPLERIEHQVLVSVIILLSMNSYDSIPTKNKTINPLKYGAVFLTLICVSLIVCFYRLKGEYFTRKFISLDKTKDPEFVITNCNKAKSFFYSIDPVSCPIDWHAGVSLLSENKNKEAKLRLEMARKFTPYNILVLKDLMSIYKKEGNKIKTDEYCQTISRISPEVLSDTLNKE